MFDQDFLAFAFHRNRKGWRLRDGLVNGNTLLPRSGRGLGLSSRGLILGRGVFLFSPLVSLEKRLVLDFLVANSEKRGIASKK